ncbi:hypothetical protein AN640_07695 [Candidatus Epulonipiscium fishelsonii]|uniref:Uncharacterized protein n=1 Tax=Candidatus Epulonipiscium fishelsonii TaxID=77094 RepID=A0ACC8XFH6_9FIRM|nr:hypothetical protein AN640_07695 [Epulopiscium sp. SCG-D08WGA-EpuloA1]
MDLPKVGFPLYLAIGILVLDILSMQMSIIRVVYLKFISIETLVITPTLSLWVLVWIIFAIIRAYLCGILFGVTVPLTTYFLAAAFFP